MDLEDISWSKDYLLTWDDFQGEVRDTPETIEKSLKATSNIGLVFEIHPKIIIKKIKKKFRIEKITVKAIFNKKKSWVKKDQITFGRESILLKHEQGHFDLAEMYTKIAKYSLEEFVKNKTYTIKENIIEDLEKTADDESLKITKDKIMLILEDFKKRGDKYDLDTKHGTVQEKQNEYNEKFDQLREN